MPQTATPVAKPENHARRADESSRIRQCFALPLHEVEGLALGYLFKLTFEFIKNFYVIRDITMYNSLLAFTRWGCVD